MIDPSRWRLREDADPTPLPRRGPVAPTGHYRAGRGVRRTLTAVVLDALATGAPVEERVGGVWKVRERRAS